MGGAGIFAVWGQRGEQSIGRQKDSHMSLASSCLQLGTCGGGSWGSRPRLPPPIALFILSIYPKKSPLKILAYPRTAPSISSSPRLGVRNPTQNSNLFQSQKVPKLQIIPRPPPKIMFGKNSITTFTARRYTQRGYATVCRLSVRPSVCLSVTFRYRGHIDLNTFKIISRRLA